MKYPLNSQAKIAKRYSQSFPAVSLLVNEGEPVYAAGDGIVVTSFHEPGAFGEYVRILHDNNITTTYAYMQRGSRQFFRGDTVKEGQIIGLTGASGKAGYPQLYFEVTIEGKIINPVRYFEVISRYDMPGDEYETHIVSEGETLTSIAKKYETTLNALKKLNDISKASDIAPEQVIKIRKRSA